MRARWLFGSLLPMFLVACGAGGSSPSTPAPVPTLPDLAPTPSPTLSPAPAPALSPTPGATATPVVGINDSYVAGPAVPSLDSVRYEKRTYQAIPSIARVGKRIWTVWLGNTRLGAWEVSGDFLTLSYSDDEGATWSREYYLVPQNPTADRTCDPSLWTAPNNQLWVIYCQSGDARSDDGQLGVWANIVADPLSDTPSFEPGFRITDGLAMRPFQARGKWYLPVDYSFMAPRFPQRAGKHLFEFDWAHRTLRYVTTVPRTFDSDYTESTYVELNDGTILAQSRSLTGILETRTAPGQFGFATPVRWTTYSSAASRHFLGRSSTGRLFMVFNKTAINSQRTDMTVAFSDDEGLSWPYAYTFDTRIQVSYPHVTFAENGDILAVYDRERIGAREIYMARIDEASIVGGTPRVAVTLVNRAKR